MTTLMEQTPAAVVLMDEVEARAATRQIVAAVEGLRQLIALFDGREGWKALGYESFRAWAEAEIPDTSLRHIYRLRAAAEVDRSLGRPIGHTPEAHARELAPVPPEERASVLLDAAHAAGERPVTARDIRTAARGDVDRLARYAAELLKDAERAAPGSERRRECLEGAEQTIAELPAAHPARAGLFDRWRALSAAEAAPTALASEPAALAALSRAECAPAGSPARGEALIEAKAAIRMLDDPGALGDRWRALHAEHQDALHAADRAREDAVRSERAAQTAPIRDPAGVLSRHGWALDVTQQRVGGSTWYTPDRTALVDFSNDELLTAAALLTVEPSLSPADLLRRMNAEEIVDDDDAPVAPQIDREGAVIKLRRAGWRAHPEIPRTWVLPPDRAGLVTEVTFDSDADEAAVAQFVALHEHIQVHELTNRGATLLRRAATAEERGELPRPEAPADALPPDVAALVQAYGLLSRPAEDDLGAWYLYWPGEADDVGSVLEALDAEQAREWLAGIASSQVAANAPECLGGRLSRTDAYIEGATEDGRLRVVWAGGDISEVTLAELEAELGRPVVAPTPLPPPKSGTTLAHTLQRCDDQFVLTLIREVAGGGETAASDEATQLRRALVAAARAWARGRAG